MADILIKLPVKSIIRFMCVCKSWKSPISRAYFISSHLRKTLNSNNDNFQIFVYQWSKSDFTGSRLLHFDDPHQDNMLVRLCPGQYWRLEIIGFVNGLICFVVNQDYICIKFIIFNPETGYFLSIPAPVPDISPIDVTKGFGFDNITLDYKIFVADPDEGYVYIYSLSCNSWKFISCKNDWFSKR